MKKEIKVNQNKKIGCDGTLQNSKHPFIYLKFEKDSKYTKCLYCGIIYKYI